jgi:TolB-like protein
MVVHVGLAYLVVAWLVMEFVGMLVERGVLGGWTAPVLIVGLAVGLPIVVGLAWTQEAATPAPHPTTKRPFWRQWAERTRPGHLLTLLAALAIALLAGQRAVGNGSRPGEPTVMGAAALDPLRIAVLPFLDQSQPQEFAHLALVFPEYLIDQLSRIGALTVLPYAAVRRYSPDDAFVDSVRNELKAGTYIEGSIIGSEEEICVFVRLVDASDFAVIQGRQHCQPPGQVLALLNTLTTDVAGALRQKLGVVVRDLERKAGTDSEEAWDFYARGREWAEDAKRLWQAGAPESALQTFARADSAFTRAQSIDPAWVDPVIERGWVTYYNSQILRVNLRTRDPAMLRHGIELSSRALELDSLNARALDLRGTLRYWLRETVSHAESVELREAAEQDLLAATQIDPTNAHAWHFLSNVLRAAGKHPAAKLAAEEALEADQFYEERALIFARLCVTSLDNRQWEEVTRWCGAGRREFPRYRVLLNAELLALASAGGPEPDVEKAWQLLEDFLESNPPQDRPALRPSAFLYVAAVLARAGLTDSAKAVIRQARAAEPAPDPMNDYNEAYVRLLLEDHDQALEFLRRHLEAMPGRKEAVATDWWFEPLRSDPRFQELVY